MTYTRLQAVNELLIAAGESIVSSLGSEGSTDTSVAEFLLDQATLEAQLRGLAGGTYITTLLKNSDDEFVLPEGTVEFECGTLVPAENASYALLVLRDGKIFSATDGTFKFPDTDLTELEIKVKRTQQWEELPLATQKAIVASAAVEYALAVGADEKTVRRAYEKEAMTRATSSSQDMAQRQNNILASGGTPTRASTRVWSQVNGRYPRI